MLLSKPERKDEITSFRNTFSQSDFVSRVKTPIGKYL